MKNILISLAFSSMLVSSLTAVWSKPKLNCWVISFLDDKPFCLDCDAMGDILHVRREVRKIQHGVQDQKSKKFVGYYIFNGEKRSLRWLADYEYSLAKEFTDQKIALEKKYLNHQPFTAEWNSVKSALHDEFDLRMHERCDYVKRTVLDDYEYDYQLIKTKREITIEHENELIAKEEEVKFKHITNKDAYRKELHEITQLYQSKISLLVPCLKAALTDFIKATAPFVIKMQGTQKLTLKLIEEFCLKYQRPRSFLLCLADIEDDQILPMFEKKMHSCQILDQAAHDLTDFLEALYYSCDKARVKFEAREREKHSKH